MAGPSTAGLAALVAGEGWHYVGDTDEIEFIDGWSNVGTPWPDMAFRYREPGIVDLVGVVTTDGSSTVILIVPDGYVPLNARRAPIQVTRLRSGAYSARIGTVDQSGYLMVADADTAGDTVYISGSYFIGNASAP